MKVYRAGSLAALLVASVCRGADPGTESVGWQPLPGHTQIAIWPGLAPDVQSVPGPEADTQGAGGRAELLHGTESGQSTRGIARLRARRSRVWLKAVETARVWMASIGGEMAGDNWSHCALGVLAHQLAP
jgi:hypothetical protein